MQKLVQRCADLSTYCPTPRELRNVAIGIRDERERQKLSDQHAKWEAIYGPPDRDWPAQMMGVLAGAKSAEQLRALHIRAVRDILYYTEGEGRDLGGRKFWQKAAEVEPFPELVDQVRAAGGWRNERELQMDWVDVPWRA
jgi:hypothetical protein